MGTVEICIGSLSRNPVTVSRVGLGGRVKCPVKELGNPSMRDGFPHVLPDSQKQRKRNRHL